MPTSTDVPSNPPAMRPNQHRHRRNLSTEVSESARLDFVVAQSADLDVAAAIGGQGSSKSSAGSSVPAVAHIQQRDFLFYDERLPVFVVLQILAPLDDALYEHYLARLAVSLEVTAVDSQHQSQGYHSKDRETTHVLFQTVIDEQQTPRIQIQPLAPSLGRLAVWKLEVPLGHPEARLNDPKILITCSATLRPADLQKPLFKNDYLASKHSTGMNLLEAFSEDPLLPHVSPRLSALRVSRVIPVTQSGQQSLRPLGYAIKKGFSVYPAIKIRLRYSRIPSASKQVVIASLILEVAHSIASSVTISNIDIVVAGGRADILASPSTTLPITCRPRDDITLLYTLSQFDSTPSARQNIESSASQHASQVRAISVSLEASAHVSDTCRAKILTHWTTSLDFAPPLTRQFPVHSGIQRAHRPPSLGSIIHGATTGAFSRPVQISSSPSSSSHSTHNAASTPPTDNNLPSLSTTEAAPMGLTITFSGPPRVYIGEHFIWKVFIVNRSNRTRKLALVIPSKRRKIGEGKSLPAPPHSGPPEPVIDDAMIWQTHRSQHLEPSELVPLVNDLRIGPLMPSACHTCELKFVGISTGSLSLEVIRVTDLANNETIECRDLPGIVAIRPC